MGTVWKLVKKGVNDVFEAAPVRPGVAVPATHVIGVVIDTDSPEGITIMMNLGEISDIYWMSRNWVCAAIFSDGTTWVQAQALLKRAADQRDAQILSYVMEGRAKAQVRAGLARMRRKYGY